VRRTTFVLRAGDSRGSRLCAKADAKGRPRTYGGERVCAVSGCETRLSTYNPSSICSLHEGGWSAMPPARRHPAQKRPEMERGCAYELCGRAFLTTNPSRRYCSDACRMRAFQGRAHRRTG
jgi:hypothetical protein